MKVSEWWMSPAIAFLLFCSTSPAHGSDCFPVLGRWPYGPADKVEFSGSYLYFNQGSVLTIADASDVAQPSVIGEIDIEEVISDVEVDGGYAYVVPHGPAEVMVLDVRDPVSPELVSRLQVSQGQSSYDVDAEVRGDLVYLADWFDGVWVIDVGDPHDPVLVGTYVPSAGQNGEAPRVLGFALGHRYGYVVVGESHPMRASMRVVDFASPSAPVEIGLLENPLFSGTTAVAVNGIHVAVSGGVGLQVVDVSDPTAPSEVGFLAEGRGAGQLIYQGDSVISAHHTGLHTGLRIYDVSDPSEPRYVAYGVGGDEVFGLALADDLAFVVVGEDGLKVVDIGQLELMTEAGAAATPGSARDLDVATATAYIADGMSGLRIVDVGQPGAPVEVGSCDTPGFARAVDVDDERAYVADGSEGVRIVDVSDPFSPFEAGVVPGTANRVDVNDGIALIAASGDGLKIVDVGEPSQPVEIATVQFDGPVTDVRRGGGLVLVAVSGEGLKILDISQPGSPAIVGSYEEGGVNGLAFDSGYAYLSRSTGLTVVDIREPSTPVLTSSVYLYDLQPGIEVRDGLALLPAGSDGLHVYDVSDPADPIHLGFYVLAGEAQSVRFEDGYAFVATGDDGLRIVEVGSPSLPPVVGVYEATGATETLAAYENFVYVIKETGVQVFRMTPAGRPVKGRFVQPPVLVRPPARVEGDRLYLALGDQSGVAILSLASPGNPRLVGTVGQPRMMSFAVEGSLVYEWVSGTGLLIFDVGDPGSPVERGRIDSPNTSFGSLSVSDGLAVSVNGGYPDDHVVLFDVSDPSDPYRIGSFSQPDGASVYSAALHENLLITSVIGSAGSELRSYDVRDPSPPVLIDTVPTWFPSRAIQFEGRRLVALQAWGLGGYLTTLEVVGPGLLKPVDLFPIPSVETVAVADRLLHVALGPIGFESHDFSQTCDAPRYAGGRAGAAGNP